MDIKELQEKILELTDLNNTLKNEVENQKKLLTDKEQELNTVKEESNKRILELQEHNQKLFLKVTQPKEEPKENEEFKSKLLGDLAIELSDEQKEFLKELEEGL